MIHELVSDCFKFSPAKKVFLSSSHTHGVQSEALRNLMNDHKSKKEITVENWAFAIQTTRAFCRREFILLPKIFLN